MESETCFRDRSAEKTVGGTVSCKSDCYLERSEDGGLCLPGPAARKLTWSDIKRQILAINVGYLPYTNGGMALAFSNLVLDEMDISSSSWFASLIGLSTPVGALISGPLMDLFGRKGVNMVIAILCIPAWFVTGYVNLGYHLLLYAARVNIGLAAGIATANIIYVSEVSHKQYRPAFLTFANIYFSFGILLVSSLQMFFTWRQVSIFIGLFFVAIFILNVYLIPESPLWLAQFRGDWSAAKISLQWLNPNPEVFAEEWNNLRHSVSQIQESNQKRSFNLRKPTVYKPFLIMIILFSLQQLSFIYALIIYAVKVFPFISPDLGRLVKSEAFALLGIIRFIGNILCSFMSLKVGRRPLLLMSSFGMIITCLLEIFVPLIWAGKKGPDSFYVYNWSLQIFLFGFVFFCTIGVMSLPWTLMSEFLPQEARSVGSAVIICYGYFLMFVIAKIFPYILQIFNGLALFTFISVISTITFVFVYYFVPETLGKSYEEIEKIFSN